MAYNIDNDVKCDGFNWRDKNTNLMTLKLGNWMKCIVNLGTLEFDRKLNWNY